MSKFGKRRQRAYLEALRNGARRGAAAASVGVTRQTVWAYRREHPEFAEAEEQAEMEANELVEDSLFQAAVSGNVVASLAWLYNRMPDRWQDRRNVRPAPGPEAPVAPDQVVEEITLTVTKRVISAVREVDPNVADQLIQRLARQSLIAPDADRV